MPCRKTRGGADGDGSKAARSNEAIVPRDNVSQCRTLDVLANTVANTERMMKTMMELACSAMNSSSAGANITYAAAPSGPAAKGAGAAIQDRCII